MPGQTAVVLINTGTPDSYKVSDVRRYLRQFLGDGKVIDLPWLIRKILVNGIIAPIRGPRSAKLYRKIWTNEGSPLLVNSLKFSKALETKLGNGYKVYMAMRYGNPGLESCIKEIAETDTDKIIVLPLYPQFAESTTGTSLTEFNRLITQYNVKAQKRVIEPFFATAAFINAFTARINEANTGDAEHIIFSFHGLPVKQTEKMHPGLTCQDANCRNDYNLRNCRCYYASCHQTARLLAEAAGLQENRYTVCFQSRLGMNWLKPYTDEVLKEMALKGLKNVLVISPAFVADCLETIYELGIEYYHWFIANGGEKLTLVESLNDNEVWVGGMAELITSRN